MNLAAHSDQRVAVFIDTQNLYHSAKSNYRANVNYANLIEQAVGGRRLVRAFAYVIKSEENTEEKFFGALEDIGIEIRVKDLQVFHTGAKKADWDVGLAVDMIRLTEKVDTVVLASGDGDFLEVIRYCQSRGVRVEVMAFEKTTNAALMEEVDYFVDLGVREFLIGGSVKGYSTPRRKIISKEDNLMTDEYYGGSSLSSVNRSVAQQQTAPVSPALFGYKKQLPSVRKVKPVVGLPTKYPSRNLHYGAKKTNEPSKSERIGMNTNAFGNPKPAPKKTGFNWS